MSDAPEPRAEGLALAAYYQPVVHGLRLYTPRMEGDHPVVRDVGALAKALYGPQALIGYVTDTQAPPAGKIVACLVATSPRGPALPVLLPAATREWGADRSVHLHMRVTPAERDAYDAAAEAAGVSRSEWLRALAAEALSAGESRSLLSDVQRVVGAMAPPGKLEIYPIATDSGCMWGWTARAEVGDAVDEITRALSGLRGDTLPALCERTRAWVTARSITHGPTNPAAPPTRT